MVIAVFFSQAYAQAEADKVKAALNKDNPISGLKLGVGLSLTHDLGENDRVDSASVVNGIVRVESENNDVVRIMLESHFFFPQEKDFPLFGRVKGNQWGWGPFVAIQPGSNEIIDAIGFGVMVGFKRTSDPSDASSWNIGMGFVVDPNVKVLGDGIQADQPLPPGETEVRFKEKSQWGLLIITSFTF